MSESSDQRRLARDLKHQAVKQAFKDERKARTQALAERKQIQAEIGHDARGFASAVSARKKAITVEPAQPVNNIQRATISTPPTQKDAVSSDARGEQTRGIPLVFYCYVEGKIGTVSLYAMANPQKV